ncbi:MAG: hypothetical protein LBI53_03680 [Candidatus Peribacteria bacterium]|nr:hypothetical protein [Candidatus Peribacteria bacterium]
MISLPVGSFDTSNITTV